MTNSNQVRSALLVKRHALGAKQMRPNMTPKEAYEASRAPRRDERMAEETAYAASRRKEAAADECFTVMLDGLKAFFDGSATLHISPNQLGNGQMVRFIKDTAR